jgi:predicted PurR-regulated permease PerM
MAKLAEGDNPPTGVTPTPPASTWDLTRILLSVAAIGGLIVASFWILRPFLPALIWATMIVVATWPALRAVQAHLWDRRGLAVTVMTLVMLMVVIAPIAIVVSTIVEHGETILAWTRALEAFSVPGPPEWVRNLPVVGDKVAAEWKQITLARSEDLAARLTPYLKAIAFWILAQVSGLGALFIQLPLTVAIAGILYAKGDAVAAAVRTFARRLAGEAGERVAILSAQAVRAVALGIVVTALIQSIAAGIGLAITGVPRAGLLTAVMFLLGVAQIGPLPVLIGAVAWLYWKEQALWGTVMIVWAIVTVSLDNLLRPLLIKRGADLPLLLIFAGVVGGLLAFGIIGLFIGPVVLAVTYTLLQAWVAAGDTEPSDDSRRAQGAARDRGER